MIYRCMRARILVVILQLLFLSLPVFADFNPTNPPEPNITKPVMVGVYPAEAGWAYGEGNYREGSNVYIETYSYRDDYKFLYWTINGYVYNYNTSFNYTMGDSAVVFIANYEYVAPTPPPFEPINPPEPYVKQNITVELDPDEGGYTEGSGSYTTGDYVWIAANLETNYELEYWTINGYPWHETNNAFSYVVGDTNAHFVAHIAEKSLLTLRTKPRAAGTSTMAINGNQFTDMLVASGKVIDFNTIGNEEYTFSHWTINGYVQSTSTSFQYTMGDSAASVVAVYDYIGVGDTTLFDPDSPPEPDLREEITILVQSADESKGTVAGGGTYLYGTIDTLYAYPNEGFAFRRWNDSVTDNPRIIQATQDSVFIAYFGNDTAIWNDTICYGDTLHVGDTIFYKSGHYEFYSLRTDGYFTWNIVDLTVWHQMSTSLQATICAGDTFSIGEIEYTESGTYLCTLQNDLGCDSIVTLTLNVLPQVESKEEYVTICYGETYTWAENGKTYTQSTTDSILYTTIHGCDSIVTLNLTILPAVDNTIITDTICSGNSYTWSANGKTYFTDAVDTVILSDRNGCDSVLILQLTQVAKIETVFSDTICYGDTLVWNVNGQEYTTSAVDSIILPSSQGCDSIVKLNLTVLPEIPETVYTDTICEGNTYIWSVTGQTYTTTTDTSVVLTSVNGCDSIVRLQLYARPIQNTIITDTICYGESFAWEGETYTTTTSQSVTYTDIHGCDSILTLNLIVLPAVDNTLITDTICAGNSYTWSANGKTYFTDAVDTVILSDRNGCDSVLILQLTQVAKIETVFSDTICYGDTLVWNVNGQEYTTSAVDSIILPSSQGCDSIVKLNLTVLPEIPETVYTDTICEGNTYIWSVTGQTYTTTTDTSVVLTSVNGCDSIVRLELYARPIQKTIITDTICYGDTYTWSVDGQTYSTTTIAKDTFMNVNGCDSIIELHLTVLPAVLPTVDSVVVAFGETYTWHEEVYNTSGDYTLTLQDIHGCDSVLVLHLIVLPKVPVTEDSVIICAGESYTWQGSEYAASGDYSLTLQDSLGYDSILILHLTVMEPIYTNLYDTACGSYTWINSGITYTQSGIYTDSLLSMYGCDSIVTLHLTINHSTIGEPEHITICYGDSYLWNGTSYDIAGEYSTTLVNVAGCDSVATLHLTVLPQSPITEEYATITKDYSYHWNGTSYTDAGDYTVTLADSNGCDSVVVLHLMVADTDFSVVTHEQCADDPMIEFEMHNHASFKYFYLRWDETAHAQNLQDTIVEVFNDYISIPNTARAGVYNVEVSALVNKTQYVTQSNTITLLYPSSVLDQHWDDFIGVLTHDYNGGYDFVSFQWYKNNEPIPGENRSYIATSLEMGASYSALLEDANGVKLMTCPIIATHKEELSLYPSMLSPRQTMHLHISHYATILFYTLNGDLIYSTEEEAGDILLQAPERGGLYIVQVIYHNNENQVLTRKITVR